MKKSKPLEVLQEKRGRCSGHCCSNYAACTWKSQKQKPETAKESRDKRRAEKMVGAQFKDVLVAARKTRQR